MSELFPVYTLTVDEAENDLKDIGREKSMLRMPAYIWERHAGDHCVGSCRRPHVIAVDVSGTQSMTCCELRPAYDRLMTLRRLEDALRGKIRNARELEAA